MTFALIGSEGAGLQTGSNATNTPVFGTGQTRTANNLLVCWCDGTLLATLPGTPAGWTMFVQRQGTNCSATIFVKIAAGADSAPTIAAATGTIWSTKLNEYSGNATVSFTDKSGTAAGTNSPQTATASGADVASGELVLYAGALLTTNSPAVTVTPTLNNGASANDTNNGASNVRGHYDFGWGITTGNGGADTYSFAYSAGTLTTPTAAVVVGSILLAATAYTQSPTGSLSFTGAQRRQTARSQAAMLSFTGAQAKQSTRAQPGALSFSAAQAKQSTRALAAVVSFAGALSRTVSAPLGAALSYIGVIAKQTNVPLAAGLGLAGSQVRQLFRSLAASLSLTAAVSRQTGHRLAATITAAGQLVKLSARNLSATLGLAAVVATTRAAGHQLSASLSFVGQPLTRVIRVGRVAVLALGGSVVRSGVKALSGVLSVSGSARRSGARALTAALTSTGALISHAPHKVLLAGSVGFHGVVVVTRRLTNLVLSLPPRPRSLFFGRSRKKALLLDDRRYSVEPPPPKPDH